ncbi:MAG TPA: methyltransferase domain-containing protein [Xanthobacteraceae bacterium]|nr:methyltransferase domain-containing protein [Xanthobacteraceae bacterium]
MSHADEIRGQYRDSSKLARRANLHKYGSPSGVSWFDWIAQKAALPADTRVLDVGCGPGWMWRAGGFPSKLDLTLTDISDGMVSEAITRVRGFGRYRSVEGPQADALSLPFRDQSFGAVLACHMLYHVSDPGSALDEMIRVLRPGGMLVVTTTGIDNMSEMYALAHAAWGAPATDPGGERFGLEAAGEALRARLNDVESASVTNVLRVTDGEDIVSALASYPPGEHASPHQLGMLRTMITTRMTAENGVFSITTRQGLVKGRSRQLAVQKC